MNLFLFSVFTQSRDLDTAYNVLSNPLVSIKILERLLSVLPEKIYVRRLSCVHLKEKGNMSAFQPLDISTFSLYPTERNQTVPHPEITVSTQ
jgi:hypothetical protein